jgi:hypothetical protein
MLQVAINIPGSMARLLILKTAEGPSALPDYRRCCRTIGTTADVSAPAGTPNPEPRTHPLNKMLNIRHLALMVTGLPPSIWHASVRLLGCALPKFKGYRGFRIVESKSQRGCNTVPSGWIQTVTNGRTKLAGLHKHLFRFS